jgi:hypothetical protein
MRERIRHEKIFKFRGLKFKGTVTVINGDAQFRLQPSNAALKWLEEDEDNFLLVTIFAARLFKPPQMESRPVSFLERLTASVN